MNFENKKLKSAAELAMEKAEAGEKNPEEKLEIHESKAEIDHQKAETSAMEIKSQEDDIEKIKAIGEKLGVDVSISIGEKQRRVNELGMIAPVEKVNGAEDGQKIKEDEFDINKWNRKEVSVRRSSGEIENGWYVQGDTKKGVVIIKQEGGDMFLKKIVPHEEFLDLNKEKEVKKVSIDGEKIRANLRKYEAENEIEEPVPENIHKGVEYAKMLQASEKYLSAKEQLRMSRLELAEFILKKEIDNAKNEEDLKNIFRPAHGKLELMMELNGGNNLYSNEKTYNEINKAFRDKTGDALTGITRTAGLRNKVREILGV